MVRDFGTIWTIRGSTLEEKVDVYYDALKKYKAEDIIRGGQRCLDTSNKFPIPSEIVEKMDLNEFTREDYRISYKMRCRKCGHFGLGIEEPINSDNWKCRKCYTGLTSDQIKGRFQDIYRMIEQPGYRPEWLKQIEEG